MADGDISKELVNKVRIDLDDLGRKIIKTDDIIYRKLSFYQKDWSKRFKCIKLVIQYDLVANQSIYPIESKVVSINNIKFYDPSTEDTFILYCYWNNGTWDYCCESFCSRFNPKVFISPLTKHEARQIVLSGSENFTAGQVMYADAYIQATDDDKISRTNDPIIGEDYTDYLYKAVLSEYRYLRPDFQKLESIEERVKDTAFSALSINRAVLNQPSWGARF